MSCGLQALWRGVLPASFGIAAAWIAEVKASDPASGLIASAPVLQNAAETSIGVSFAVTADASGWVEYSTARDMGGARRVYSGEHGLMTVDDRVALVRLTELAPATRYYYRIGADRIEYRNAYAMKNLGSELDSKIHSFVTLGSAAVGSFCVINDTHDSADAVKLVLGKVAELNPSVVIWNGDAADTCEKMANAISVFLKPHRDFPDYASDTPYMFLNGNHDFRGRFSRRLGDLMMFREPAERTPEYAELGRNFVQRLGDVALIGLDTGEDKVDEHPAFAGIFKMRSYLEKQAKWLEEAVASDVVRSAKYKVAFCHIPLNDPRPRADGWGDPKTNAADWHRVGRDLWGPALVKAGVQLVVSGHQHRFRYDAPDGKRPWAQIVGGGPELGFVTSRTKGGEIRKVKAPSLFPTVVEGRVVEGSLCVTVHDVLNRTVVGRYRFAPLNNAGM